MGEQIPVTLQDLPVLLEFISASDRDTWVQVGMGIKAEFGGDGWDAWNTWSQSDKDYKSSDAESVWKSFRKSGTGFGTVLKLALDNGWTPEKTELSAEDKRRFAREQEARRKARQAEVEADEALLMRTQATWNVGAPNWTDAPQGNSTTANYNQLSYPLIITNRGAIDAKWALVFTGTTSFNVVEEKLGVIATGTTSSDCSPINPETSEPYFTIRKEGWGSGWFAGNGVRFNTDSCLGPLWVVRTVLSGQGTVEDDQFKLQIRGDAD